jgi:hypothetical protein
LLSPTLGSVCDSKGTPVAKPKYAEASIFVFNFIPRMRCKTSTDYMPYEVQILRQISCMRCATCDTAAFDAHLRNPTFQVICARLSPQLMFAHEINIIRETSARL